MRPLALGSQQAVCRLHASKLQGCAAVVSKAFSCLSDSDKRATFDRYGEEAPGLSRTRSAQEFDPNEIFNAFFGGGGGFGGGPFGGGPFQAGCALAGFPCASCCG